MQVERNDLTETPIKSDLMIEHKVESKEPKETEGGLMESTKLKIHLVQAFLKNGKSSDSLVECYKLLMCHGRFS